MALAGSGPTMTPAQLGSGVASAPWVLLGMFCGALVFTLVEPKLFSTDFKCVPHHRKQGGPKLVLEDYFGGKYADWAVPIGLVLYTSAIALELFIPPSRDASTLAGVEHGLRPWLPPIVAGTIVGLNQIPLRLLTEAGQGGSKSFVNAIATLTGGRLSGRHVIKSAKDAAQIWYVWLGTTAGAFLARLYATVSSGVASKSLASTALTLMGSPDISGYSPLESFIGGLLILFGARVAVGCTCGNGITGMSELSLRSMAATAAIFGGGILAGLALQAF